MLVAPEIETGESLQLGRKVLWKDENGKTYIMGTVSAFEPDRKLVFELDDISWSRKASAKYRRNYDFPRSIVPSLQRQEVGIR
jgi:hypothetical protein